MPDRQAPCAEHPEVDADRDASWPQPQHGKTGWRNEQMLFEARRSFDHQHYWRCGGKSATARAELGQLHLFYILARLA